jgi:ABC-type Zn uptake system ZnuABC Zn-binding protein ZnuA
MSVIQMMKKYGVRTILGASYFSVAKMKMVANKVGANLIVLTMGSKLSDNSAMDKFNRWAVQFK